MKEIILGFLTEGCCCLNRKMIPDTQCLKYGYLYVLKVQIYPQSISTERKYYEIFKSRNHKAYFDIQYLFLVIANVAYIISIHILTLYVTELN